MKKRSFKRLFGYFVVVVMASVFVLDICTVLRYNSALKAQHITPESFSEPSNQDRIHFLSTGNSDAILLESDGRFALVDCGEGSYNPRGTTTPGYEKVILDYLKKTASQPDGTIHLDFILGTHYHYDHVGGFQTIIQTPQVQIDKAYFKPLSHEVLLPYEPTAWGLDLIQKNIQTALASRNVPLISELPDQPFSFGNFTLQFFNTITDTSKEKMGENYESVGVLVTKGNEKAFLAADMTNNEKLETRIGKEIGPVDLLKLGHHGYFGASSQSFIRAVRPKIAVATNYPGKIYPNVKWNLTMISHAAIYSTVQSNGLIAAFTGDGIKMTNNIH